MKNFEILKLDCGCAVMGKAMVEFCKEHSENQPKVGDALDNYRLLLLETNYAYLIDHLILYFGIDSSSSQAVFELIRQFIKKNRQYLEY